MSSLSNDAEILDDLLIAYALGALEPAELREVAALLRTRPELRQRAAELHSVAAQLPYGLPLAEPAADLRDRVIARATGAAQPRSAPRPAKLGWFRSWGLAALAALLLVATVVLGSQLGRQGQQLAQQAQTIAQQQQQVAAQQQLIALLAAPGAQLATINGESASARLIRTPSGGAAVAAKMPPLPAGRTYQVWLIASDNQPPISAGLLSVAADGSGVLLLPASQPTLHEAAVFAITVEPSGGSPAPTTNPMVSSPFGPS